MEHYPAPPHWYAWSLACKCSPCLKLCVVPNARKFWYLNEKLLLCVVVIKHFEKLGAEYLCGGIFRSGSKEKKSKGNKKNTGIFSRKWTHITTTIKYKQEQLLRSTQNKASIIHLYYTFSRQHLKSQWSCTDLQQKKKQQYLEMYTCSSTGI